MTAMTTSGTGTELPSGDPILRVSGLKKHFPITAGFFRRTVGHVKAVDGVDFQVFPKETLGLVGESGCGKSTTGRSVLKLVEPTAGVIELDGENITGLSRPQMVRVRRKAQMIFQDPYSALNPRHTVGSIIGAPYEVQGVTPPGGVKAAVQDLMERVGLNPEHYNRFPAEFSGGQRQRIGIARAVSLRPKLIVCDEPVSALDVSIQAQVVNLLEDLQEEFGIAYLMIAHDLSVVRHISDRIAVMYLGHIVETAPSVPLYVSPRHPYTKALLSAVPVPDPTARARGRRIILEGDLPSPVSPPPGCVFHTRCWKATDVCRTQVPELVALEPGHEVACHHPEPAATSNGTFERPVPPASEGSVASATAASGNGAATGAPPAAAGDESAGSAPS